MPSQIEGQRIAAPRASWRAPSLRAVPAHTAEMPVGKLNPGGDGVTMS